MNRSFVSKRFVALSVLLSSAALVAEAQGPRLLTEELTLAPAENVAPHDPLETSAQRLDAERPPRPPRRQRPTSAGYASGRWPLMVGLSFLTAGTTLALVFSATTCYDPQERYTRADVPAAISVGVGFALTLSGAIRLARLPGVRRRPRLAGAILGTLLMSAANTLLLSIPQVGPWVGCISS